VEELVTKIMQAQKAAELFQTMAIINLNMGNLNLEVNNVKNKLALGRRRRQYNMKN
jgi:hypothetical protein